MPPSNVCWGVEVGAGAIKALKLVREGDALSVADFAVVQHARVLSTPELDQLDAIRVAIGALVSQHDLTKATLAISVPGHAAFARFAKLPPVEPKKVPDIVKFEAVQQIPFPIDEVEWDYQTFASPNTPDVEVGIFAIRRERVLERLAIFNDVGLAPDALTLSPVSAYNAVAYDLQFTEQTPGCVLVDIGTTATDLIVAEAGRVWIRTFPLGGHHFTEALANAFKLSYTKAEKLKREADQHEHKRHIFQAMKPVFSDLAQDVQRSLAYYRQLHPECDLKKVYGMGSTFRLMGLRKFLSQQLQIDVVRFDKLNRLSVEGPKASDFQSVALNMATAYGLALQGLGYGTINANLIPVAVVREAVWKRKTPWVAAAATLALVAGGVSFYRPLTDSMKVRAAQNSDASAKIQQVKSLGKTLTDGWKEVEANASLGFTAENMRRMMDDRAVMTHIVEDVGAMLASADPQRELVAGRAADIPAGERRLFEVRSFSADYVTPSGGLPKGEAAQVGSPSGSGSPTPGGRDSGGGGGGNRFTMSGGALGSSFSPSRGRVQPDQRGGEPGGASNPLGTIRLVLVVDSTHQDKQAFVDKHLLQWLRENANRPDAPYTFTTGTVDTMITKVETIKPDDRSTGAARPAAPSPSSSGAAPGGFGRRTSADTRPPATSVDALAPLPPSPDPLTMGASEIYRYTIEWQAVLRAPGAAAGAGAPGENSNR